MGYFSQLAIDVETALCEGGTVKQIAGQFGISEAEVESVIEQLESADRDPQPTMDQIH